MQWLTNLFSSSSSAVLSFFTAIIVGLLGLCGVLYSQIAPRQKNLNDALAVFLEELQKDRGQYIARCSTLEDELKVERARVKQLEGEVRNRDSVIEGLRRQANDYAGYKELAAVSYDPPRSEAGGDEGGRDI